MALSAIALANGCSLKFSTAEAIAKTSFSIKSPVGIISDTFKSP